VVANSCLLTPVHKLANFKSTIDADKSSYTIQLSPNCNIEEEFEDTKGIIRIRKSKKDRQHDGQKKKDRQYNGQQKKDRQHNGQK
jgi:hypothetical protein